MKKRFFLFGIIVLIFGVIVAIILNYFMKLDINEIATNIQIKNNDIEKESVQAELEEDYSINANVPIFMYHWIRDDVGDYPYPENMVKPAELRKQIEYLKNNDYDVIFVSDLDKLQHYNKPVVLTFDDGWVDVYYEAFPLAKEFNMKICMYVITDLIGTNGYCNIEQLKEMKDSGLVEIDSHTVSHPYLDELSMEEIKNELVNSKVYLKENLGIDSTVICYPSGRSNESVLEVASQNYDYGLLMDGGVFKYDSNSSNMYLIERIYAMRSMTIDTFENYCVSSYVKIN